MKVQLAERSCNDSPAVMLALGLLLCAMGVSGLVPVTPKFSPKLHQHADFPHCPFSLSGNSKLFLFGCFQGKGSFYFMVYFHMTMTSHGTFLPLPGSGYSLYGGIWALEKTQSCSGKHSRKHGTRESSSTRN